MWNMTKWSPHTVITKEDYILSIYIAAKDISASLNSLLRRWSALVLKVGVCGTCGEAFKRILVHSVVLTISYGLKFLCTTVF